MGLATEITSVRLSSLEPDPHNPRLPIGVKDNLFGDDLLVYIADGFDPLVIADSIARHGYFGSEPLIAMRDGDRWLVLEGNRRLTALLGLARPDLRDRFADAERWNELQPAVETTLESSVPIIVAGSREDADAVIGFRHIGQILEWKPLQRAQFIAYLVDERNQSFAEVSDTVGEDEDAVKMLYRNQGVLSAAAELGRRDILEQGQRSFGIYTAALNRTALREFVEVAAVGNVQERAGQLTSDRLPELSELFGWVFGGEAGVKVISESRELRLLANVVQHPTALAELRRSRDLESAYAMTDIPRSDRDYLRQLATAAGHLRSVVEAADLIASNDRARELSEEMRSLLDELDQALDSPEDEA